ncbi:MAG: RNA-splicing ligase RtcB [Candidatus Moranbacteria bacterium RIFCSPHIGHO2_12_FULL_40_10]|nr:MAG: RNA-splicing ligase RtcB [Candidatus Moranbacteria bacterium RIFCSPHIGHO2_12_FULL_40_10]
MNKQNLIKITDYLWEIPKSYRADMKVPARVFASEKMLEELFRDRSMEQLINVTALPGIQKAAYAMPDAHEGYGFPIGGVAATSYPNGAISPGGIGYDINCGVRLLKSELNFEDVKNNLEKLAGELFSEIPSGVGRGGKIKLDGKKLGEVLNNGAEWAVKEGYGNKDDLNHIESNGKIENADAGAVSDHAKKRGRDQLGTLGAGNHFIEVGKVEEVFDGQIAESFGLRKNQTTVLIHTGSRGLGHQVATDYIRIMNKAMSKYKITVPDRELVCVPFSSPEGQKYFSAMAAAANFAWANRQLITWLVRKIWAKIFDGSKLSILYDVAHNIAKIEEHYTRTNTDNIQREPASSQYKSVLIVHRKGATRAFPGQPVIIPGSMGTASYVLVGTDKAMEESFGSTCHGAGRQMSRHQAKRMITVDRLKNNLKKENIIVKAGSIRGLVEEAPEAYKNIHDVVDIVDKAGIAKKVARLKPLVVIKG